MKVAEAVPELPSATDALPIEMVGGASSLVIVPTPWLSAIVALTAPERFTKNVSSASLTVSPTTGTKIFWVVCPGVKANDPEVDA